MECDFGLRKGTNAIIQNADVVGNVFLLSVVSLP